MITASRSPTVPITACRRRSGAPAAKAAEGSSVFPTTYYGTKHRHARSSSGGHAQIADLARPGVCCLSKRPTIRRRTGRAARRAAGFRCACGFVVGKAAGYEADDFLAAAVAAEERRGGTALVASGDRDAFQLASQSTTILQPVKAGEIARIGPKEVQERYGVEPRQVPDFIALRGDPSAKFRVPAASAPRLRRAS